MKTSQLLADLWGGRPVFEYQSQDVGSEGAV